ncbi:capsule biosynthesis GfcC family protein [Vibrio sp. Of7-15]|uniref:capsule biosynthesis GfcC D2 domain-containing protein n=1 Tax=Vibrio sp. Of7-15 TaxID=2724879 RepID=UPI001EF39F56|nr:capsule biosynthesis GfcC D2 domain-containing protein [Vibrio sp. Of7-15]MCG7496833.1 capsule biosynthesis GfcC family protein [Vibrio sp. Of7-15]
MKKRILATFIKVSISLLTLPSISTQATQQHLDVLLVNQKLKLEYPAPARLEQVVSDIHSNTQSSLYWLGTQLFDESKQHTIDTKKQYVLEQLSQLKAQEPELIESIKKLESQLLLAEFKDRQFISLDHDVIRISEKANPLLKGNFSFYLETRPETISITGLTKKSLQVPFIEHGQVSDYLVLEEVKENLLSEANNSFVYIIQPDGNIIEVPYTYWNKQSFFLAPGSIIFIGFNSLTQNFSKLNAQIAQLLRHKVNL